jgi:hypothetical protein
MQTRAPLFPLPLFLLLLTPAAAAAETAGPPRRPRSCS